MITVLALLAVTQATPALRLAHAEIWFDARASVADFQGRTSRATGNGTWVEVRWEDIDTKNGTRNRHMLKTVDAEHFPVIRFDLKETTADTGSVQLKGTLALHGVSQPVDWPAEIRVAADSITVSADSPVDIRDFGIKPPVRFVIARMGAVVQVHVRLTYRKDQTRG